MHERELNYLHHYKFVTCRSYKTRLDKEKLHEMFHLHRENAEKWNANTLGEKYSLDPKKIEKILKFYSPLTLHMHMKE